MQPLLLPAAFLRREPHVADIYIAIAIAIDARLPPSFSSGSRQYLAPAPVAQSANSGSQPHPAPAPSTQRASSGIRQHRLLHVTFSETEQLHLLPAAVLMRELHVDEMYIAIEARLPPSHLAPPTSPPPRRPQHRQPHRRCRRWTTISTSPPLSRPHQHLEPPLVAAVVILLLRGLLISRQNWSDSIKNCSLTTLPTPSSTATSTCRPPTSPAGQRA